MKPGDEARPRFIDAGALTEPADYSNVGMVLVAPPPHAIPSIDAAGAFAAATQPMPASTPFPATVALALVTSPSDWNNGELDQRLVYSVRWEQVSWMPSGPAPGPGEAPPPREAVVGPMTAFIDAMTGERMGTMRTGRAPNADERRVVS